MLRGQTWRTPFSLSVPSLSKRMVAVSCARNGFVTGGRIISDLVADDQFSVQIYTRWPCFLDLGGQEASCPPGSYEDELFTMLPDGGLLGKGGVFDLSLGHSSGGDTAVRSVLLPFFNYDSPQVPKLYVVIDNKAAQAQNFEGDLRGMHGFVSFQ